jgi:CheY-like chemotaxis protein
MALILLATPDYTLAAIFAAELEGAGYTVRIAEDGQDAYDAGLAAVPDLVLLDASLPVFTGLETARLFRGDPTFPRELPVVLLSDDEQNPIVLEAAGVTACLPKNHGAAEFLERVVDWLGDRAGG